MNHSTNLQRKRLPVGISDFKKLRESDYYYVDKSEFIEEVLDASAEMAAFQGKGLWITHAEGLRS